MYFGYNNKKGWMCMEYRLETLSRTSVLGVKKEYGTGQKAQEDIFNFWMDFDNKGKKQELMPLGNDQLQGLLAVYKPHANGEVHCLIGVTNDTDEAQWQRTELSEGRYIVFDAKGPVPESIKKGMEKINRHILPTLDYEFRDAPFFELYKEGPIRSEEYITEIWLPIV